MKKILMTILALIVGAVFVAVVVYYVFPEKTAAFIIDKARSGAGFKKNHKKSSDRDYKRLRPCPDD